MTTATPRIPTCRDVAGGGFFFTTHQALNRLMHEVFLTVTTHPKYLIGNEGTVLSLKGSKVTTLKPSKDKWGYLGVNLYMDGEQKRFKIHRLVATHFIRRKSNAPREVNHIDGDKTNNCVDNLEWVTRSENMEHAYETGLRNLPSESAPSAKLTNEEVEEIRRRYENEDIMQKKLAAEYGVDQSQISRLLRGETW
jgi:predicted XRE-type DNA-binding protein